MKTECSCGEEHTHDEAYVLGLICARCNTHTGNDSQGHYWSFCTDSWKLEKPHFCCPNGCELKS